MHELWLEAWEALFLFVLEDGATEGEAQHFADTYADDELLDRLSGKEDQHDYDQE